MKNNVTLDGHRTCWVKSGPLAVELGIGQQLDDGGCLAGREPKRMRALCRGGGVELSNDVEG